MLLRTAGIVVMSFVLGGSAVAKTTVSDGVIDSVSSIQSLLDESRLQYLPVSPPTSEPYVDIRKNVLAVDWKGFKNKAFTSQMYAEMDVNGFPIYRVGVRQEFSGETVFLNSFGIEVLRLPAPKYFNVYAWAEGYFQTSVADLSEMQRLLYPSSKIQLELVLLPEVFYLAYQEIEAEQAVLEQGMAPMMMAMSSSAGGTTPLPVDVVPQTNGTVELQIDTVGTAVRHIEIFSRYDLNLPPGWSLTVNNLNATNGIPSVWSDATTNKMFYYVNDADHDGDGDGYSDLRERLITQTQTNVFDYVDADSDGLHDWYEIRFWDFITHFDEMDDPDGDGLASGLEMGFLGTTNVVMLSDPSLYDTDWDGLSDSNELFRLPPTDPWDSDVSAPVATIVSPTNNTIVVFSLVSGKHVKI